MSRRTPAVPDTAERNRTTLKQLVKIESNKSCADCKRNKHPRWASWNIGVFVCIRCSGIHRGMGTHVSRVKSVDLDSWTDEQLANMLKWGNARANKYWEHKLAEGHVPNEAKIENFIRTKYDSRRWVMEGPVPEPSTLEVQEADDDVALNVVQQQARQRGVSGGVRNGSAPAAVAAVVAQPRARPQDFDLFGDDAGMGLARPSTTEPAMSRPGPPKAPLAPPKQTRPGESLLGLDFFGGAQSAPPARPSSTGASTPGVPGRADLKSSILSLYASKPAAPPPQPQQTSNIDAFGGMQSPPMTTPQSNTQSLGGMGDAFGSLSFSSPQQKPPPFSGFTSPAGHTRKASLSKSSALSGGSFFDAKPAPPPKPTSPPSLPMTTARKESFGGDFGDFSTAAASPPSFNSVTKSPPAATTSMGDLFDVSAPAPPPKQPTITPAPAKSPPPISASSYMNNSAFNLSQPTVQPSAVVSKPAPAQAQTSSLASFNMDPWGSSDAWATADETSAPAPAPAPPQTSTTTFTATKPIATAPPRAPAPAPAPVTTTTTSAFDSNWGDPEPRSPAKTTTSAGGFSVQQDEEFGGWSHASPVATTPGPSKAGGLGSNADDLFGNVWG